jgi:hypothetical protein
MAIQTGIIQRQKRAKSKPDICDFQIIRGLRGIMLSEQQKQKYELARQMAKEELELLDKEMNAELARAKERLLELQQAKKAVKQIYDGACMRMGIKSVLEMKDFSLSDLVKQG